MKKLFILFGFLFLCVYPSINQANEVDKITYEWLLDKGNTSGYTDHIRHFHEIFQRTKIRTFLEFGLGYSTKYFLDKCNKVISVEFVTHGAGPEWVKKCLQMYSDYSNWIPITFFTGYHGDVSWAPYKYMGTDSVYKATSYQTETHLNYALIDDSYVQELDTFIHNITKYNKVDLAFVDSGLYLRGDLVQLLFDKVPIIVAHDYYVGTVPLYNDVYGYSRIETPDNYEPIYVPHGHGIMIWIVKEDSYQSLTEELKSYARSFSEKE